LPFAGEALVLAPALVVPDDLPELLLLVVGEGVERRERLLVDVDVLVVIRVVVVLGLEADQHHVAELPAVVGEGEPIRAEVVLLLVGVGFDLGVHGPDHLHLAEALPIVLRNDAREAAQVVEREVGARDGVGALCGGDSAHAAQRRHVDPGVVVLRVVARVVRRLVAIGDQHDAAGVEGRVDLHAEGVLALLAAEDVAVVAVEVLLLDAVGELHGLRGALVVEWKLLSAVPVGVEEAGVGAVSIPLIVEVPHPLDAGLRIALAVDRFPGEGHAGDVVLEAPVGADARLAAEALTGILELLRLAVVGGGPDLELHALVEEEVPVVPECRRQEGLELLDLVHGDDVAFLELRHQGAGVLGLLGEGRSRQQQRGQKRECGGRAHGGVLLCGDRQRGGTSGVPQRRYEPTTDRRRRSSKGFRRCRQALPTPGGGNLLRPV
jgi:hypothetical protein